MENQNILTIKFNTLDDLAVQVADWNERLNHQCQGQCMSEKPIVKVKAGTSLELAESKLEDTFKKAIVVVTDDDMNPIACLELATGNKVKKGQPKFNHLVQAKLFANAQLKKRQ